MPAIRVLPLTLSLLMLAACGGSNPGATPAASPQGSTAATAGNGSSDASLRIGDVTIRTSVVQTSVLPESIARKYGIDRDARTALLLVTVRKGPDASAEALPATITATVTDLRGGRQDLEMRAVVVDSPDAGAPLTDYIGTVSTTLPDTLRFDVRVLREDGAVSTLQLSRDFYPQ